MLAILLFAVSLLVFYFVIRKAVMDGILDADRARQARDRAEWSDRSQTGDLPDGPKA